MSEPYFETFESTVETVTTTQMVLISVFSLVSAAIAIALGWYFPIMDTTGVKNKSMSVFLALFVFPIYLFVFTFQYPYVDQYGQKQPLLSFIILFLFWPAIFVFADTNQGARVQDIKR